jgi:heme/copper-type cytochrome/quinol oxidase subunit 4
MNHRNQTLYRTVATLTGDITIGLLFSSICIWIINFAALGIFLSFLAWLIVTILAMAASQYLIHPTVNFLLSDRKLESAVQKVHGLTGVFIQVGHAAAEKARMHLGRKPNFTQRNWASTST